MMSLMPLNEEQLRQLFDFIGYGNLDAKMWFLGMEEAGGGEDNLLKRLRFRTVEDLYEGHKILGILKHHEGRKKLQSTWNHLCYIMLCLQNKPSDRESRREYQVNSLGRHSGNTLLAELMPIPKPSITTWDYPNLLPQYQNASEYYADIEPRRIAHLRELAHVRKPKVVIAYGQDFWPLYKKIFEDVLFSTEGKFQHGKNETTFVVLAHHLTARSMNGEHPKIVNIIQRNTTDLDSWILE